MSSAVECDRFTCSVGAHCGNRLVVRSRRLEQFLRVIRTKHCGYGLRTTVTIAAETCVVEYVGEYLPYRTYIARVKDGTAYYMRCTGRYGIDARNQSNLAS